MTCVLCCKALVVGTLTQRQRKRRLARLLADVLPDAMTHHKLELTA